VALSKPPERILNIFFHIPLYVAELVSLVACKNNAMYEKIMLNASILISIEEIIQ
jgi:hypothetical protein